MLILDTRDVCTHHPKWALDPVVPKYIPVTLHSTRIHIRFDMQIVAQNRSHFKCIANHIFPLNLTPFCPDLQSSGWDFSSFFYYLFYIVAVLFFDRTLTLNLSIKELSYEMYVFHFECTFCENWMPTSPLSLEALRNTIDVRGTLARIWNLKKEDKFT